MANQQSPSGFEGAGTSALLILSGEMPLNHAAQLGRVLRYANVVTLSTNELEESLTTVGLPSDNTGIMGDDRGVQAAHTRERAGWIRDLVAAEHGMPAYSYDVHLIDGRRPSQDEDLVTSHWRRMLASVVQRPNAVRAENFFPWQYEPFQQNTGWATLADRPSHGLMPDELINEILASGMPAPYESAKATLGKGGNLRSIEVEFGQRSTAGRAYTMARFVTRHSAPRDTLDELGDRVEWITQDTSRTVDLAVPPELQAQIDQINAFFDAEERRACAADEDMYFTNSENDLIETKRDRALAPLYAQL